MKKSKHINQYVKRFQEIDKTHKCVWSKREKSNESLAHWLESQALQNAKREERNTCNDNGDLTSNGE